MSQVESSSKTGQNGQSHTSLVGAVEAKPNGTWKRRLKRILRQIYQLLSSPVGLVLALAAYNFIGAAIFHVIEGPPELERKKQGLLARDKVTQSFQSLLTLSNSVQNNGSNWTWLMKERIKAYEVALLHQYEITPGNTRHVWDFWGAFLYSATIYTTIGYGHIAPTGYKGRIATMFYAILGIPLCLVVMANLGRLFTRAIKWVWARLPGCACKKARKLVIKQNLKPNRTPANTDVTDPESEEQLDGAPVFAVDDNFNLPPLLAIGIVVVYIAIGAALYGLWEDWDYLEAFYFIFVSISTIGFGDILPEHPKYFIASSIYVLFGLSLVAMVVNVIMESISEKFNKAKSTLEQKVAKAISLQDVRSQNSYKLDSKTPSKENI